VLKWNLPGVMHYVLPGVVLHETYFVCEGNRWRRTKNDCNRWHIKYRYTPINVSVPYYLGVTGATVLMLPAEL